MFEKKGSLPEEPQKSREDKEETYEEKKKREAFEKQRSEIIAQILNSEEASQGLEELLGSIENIEDEKMKDKLLVEVAEAEAKNDNIDQAMDIIDEIKSDEEALNAHLKTIPYVVEKKGVEQALHVTQSLLLLADSLGKSMEDDWLLKTIKSIVNSTEDSQDFDKIIYFIDENLNLSEEEKKEADNIYSFLSVYQARQGNIPAALEINTRINKVVNHPEVMAEIAVKAAQEDDIETAIELVENLIYMKDKIGKKWILGSLEKIAATEAGYENIEELLTVIDINLNEDKERQEVYAALVKGEAHAGRIEKAKEILQKVEDTTLRLEAAKEIAKNLPEEEKVKNSAEIARNLMTAEKRDIEKKDSDSDK